MLLRCFVACALLPCHRALVLAFFKYLLTPAPNCCSIALLLAIVFCYFTLLVGIPSSLYCATGGTWNNTNKLHPTTKFFLYLFLFV
jgi:hypothetical protein